MASINQIIDILTKIGFFSLAGWGVREWVMYMRKQKELRVKQHQADEKAQAAVLKKMNDKDVLLQNGVIAMLHHEIYDNCTHYLESGYITTGQLNDLNYLFGSYKALGGNGTGEMLYNRASALEIKEEN